MTIGEVYRKKIDHPFKMSLKHQQKNSNISWGHIIKWKFSSTKRGSVSFFKMSNFFFPIYFSNTCQTSWGKKIKKSCSLH
jgi:hypothetical protein